MNAASTLDSQAPRHETLRDALARAAADLERRDPPAAVRAAMQDAYQREGPGGRGAAPARGGWAAFALCLVVLVTSVVLMLAPSEPPMAPDGPDATAFVPVAPQERWPRDSAQPAWIVATELPRERLSALGLPFDPARAGERVRAELLLHPVSGDVLAVRVLR